MASFRQLAAPDACAPSGAAAGTNPLAGLISAVIDGGYAAKGGQPAAMPSQRLALGPHGVPHAAPQQHARPATVESGVTHAAAILGEAGHPQLARAGSHDAMMHRAMAEAEAAAMAHRFAQSHGSHPGDAAMHAAWGAAAAPAVSAPLAVQVHPHAVMAHAGHAAPHVHAGHMSGPGMMMGGGDMHAMWAQRPAVWAPAMHAPRAHPAAPMAATAVAAPASAAPAATTTAPPAAASQDDETRAAAAKLAAALDASGDPLLQGSDLARLMRSLSAGAALIRGDRVVGSEDGGAGAHPALEAARQLKAEGRLAPDMSAPGVVAPAPAADAPSGSATATATDAAAAPVEDAEESPSALEARLAEALEAGGEVSGQDFEALWRDMMSDESPLAFDSLWRDAFEQRLGEGDGEAREAATAEATELASYEMVAVGANPYTGHARPFDEGVALLREGRAREATLAFEAELREREDNAEAWRLLGECHAENDLDRSAIACLERAVEHDPYSLEALLALGVSHVNELNNAQALRTLKAWVEHNPRFQGLKIEADAFSDGSFLDDVMQLMLRAQEWDPSDPEVQEVLGVLYNVSKDFDAAAAAFRNALAARPDSHALWNKLGATLANGSKSEEAIPAYTRALELKPRYARGWMNMGIACNNLGRHKDAACAYLTALSLSPGARHIWSYLRMVFRSMNRLDLVELARQQDPQLFQAEFEYRDFAN